MRQVFSSPRLENVERVARLLRETGIEVQILNGRSYKGSRRGHFSYRDDSGGPKPSVWVTRADDQPRARALLRDNGLLQGQPSTRSYLPQDGLVFAAENTVAPKKRRMTRAAKIRYTLLGGAVLVIGLSWLAKPTADTPLQPPTAVASEPRLGMVPPTVEATVHRIPVPRALAVAVLSDALSARVGPVCVAIDGDTPSAPLLAALDAVYPDVRPASACTRDQDARLEATNYRTDGSGHGTLDLLSNDGDAAQGLVRTTLDVRRSGVEWTFQPAD